MKFQVFWALPLALFVLELAPAEEVKPPPSSAPSDTSAPELKSTLGDIHSFELALPLALEINFVHGSRGKTIALAPALGYFMKKIEVGFRAPVNYKSNHLEGAGLFFLNFYPEWRAEARRAYFIGVQGGWSHFYGRGSLRTGFSMGKIFAIGKATAPGLIRTVLNLQYDTGKSSQGQFILGLNAEVSIPL